MLRQPYPSRLNAMRRTHRALRFEPLEERRLLARLAAADELASPVGSAWPHTAESLAPPADNVSFDDDPGGGSEGPLADLVLDSVTFVDPFGNDVETPVVGQKVYVRANWRTSDLETSDQYITKFFMDGVPLESATIQGFLGNNVPFLWWHGGWIATPGMHTISVTVDGNDDITETNESNNTVTFDFTSAEVDLPQKFAWPLAGAQSVDWVVEGYVDADPRPGFELFADYQGRSATYDGHNGIDIALPHFAAMDAGVPVLAAADGTVSEIADGDFDRWLSPPFPYPVGNYVVIDHGNGWKTAYFHLRRDSVAVSVGSTVVAGQQLGLVGSSGYSLRPHLHFEVLHDNTPVEPFAAPNDYFLDPLPYTFDAPPRLLDFGITNVPPPFEAVAEHVSDIDSFPQTAAPIFFQAWAIFASLETGDEWEVQLFRPNGTLYSDFDAVVATADRAWEWSYWFGNLPPNPELGDWRADWIINGELVAQKFYTVSSTPHPEIRVYRDDALDLYGTFVDEIIIDGRTTPLDFGWHAKYDTAPVELWTVENHGYAPLDISGIDLPAGFTLVEPLDAAIPAGGSDTFAVRLDTTVPGYKSGQIVIHSNDLSESTTSFAVEGGVLPALPGDFNNDDHVDTADYVVWRKFLGADVDRYSGADTDGDGSVTELDRDYWITNFGQSISPRNENDDLKLASESAAAAPIQAPAQSASASFVVANSRTVKSVAVTIAPALREDALLLWLASRHVDGGENDDNVSAIPKDEFPSEAGRDLASLDAVFESLAV